MKRFCEFSKERTALDGTKMKIDEVLGREIIVWDFMEFDSPATCLQVQFSFEEAGEKFIFFTNSEVLTRQANQYREELPFCATVKKQKRYLTFS